MSPAKRPWRIRLAIVDMGPSMCVLVAVSALAVRRAEAAGMTLVAVARDDAFEVFGRPDRIGP